jgi:hypothetical protein
MDEEFAPLTTPGCIVKTRTVSLAFECRAEPSRAGLIMIDDEVLAFVCSEHKSTLIAPRRMLDRDRAELERRRHSWTWARAWPSTVADRLPTERRSGTPPCREGSRLGSRQCRGRVAEGPSHGLDTCSEQRAAV